MKKATTIGLDIAKQVFQVHWTDGSGQPVLRRKLKRNEVIRFFSEQPPCLVAIEASGSAHHWARMLGGVGHTVRLMAPQFVKQEKLISLAAGTNSNARTTWINNEATIVCSL